MLHHMKPPESATFSRGASPTPATTTAERMAPLALPLSLGDFLFTEQNTILTLYITLTTIHTIASRQPLDVERQSSEIGAILIDVEWKRILGAVRRIGRSMASPTMLEVCHDIRSGALTALAGLLETTPYHTWNEAEFRLIANLSYDHSLIMRTLIADLDVHRNAREHTPAAPRSLSLYERWHNAIYRIGDRSIQVFVDADYHGPLVGSLNEQAMLERVLYNLINNAAYHSDDGMVELSIQQVGGQMQHIRLSITNRLTLEQQRSLFERFPSNLDDLFCGGFATVGDGLGMCIAAQIIARIHGFTSIRECLSAGRLGVMVHQGQFICWFHWPSTAAPIEL